MEVLSVVGGAVLAPLLEKLLAELRSSDVLKYARNKGVRKELCNWEEILMTIKEVLESAEEQQRTNDRVKSWFNDLQNLAYDVEDILDEFNTKAMLQSKPGTSKVEKMIHSSISTFTFVNTAKIKNISKRLQKIKERMEFLKLSVEGSKSRIKDDEPTIFTSPLVNEAHVYGREEDLKKILEQLKNEPVGGRTPVIPIVGMGGVGKTTLAQLVYNDDALQFGFKAWVTVGESFDVLAVTKAILRQLSGDQLEDFGSLQEKLKEKLSEKKSLVVLDDVWTKDYNKWDLFYKPFDAAGTRGSRIIVTTRDEHVSLMTSGGTGYPLGELSDDECLSIIAYHAFGRKTFHEYSHLREIGGEIAKKCDGLPLAARALGGVLKGKHNASSWDELMKSKIWEEKEKSVLLALKLSYYHLPSHLKRCFGYTAIFPKDYEFDKTRLVFLWIAEGFVFKMKDGYSYFEDLLSRSFFQKSSIDESLYVMHDLINDLARSISGNICFNLDEETEKLYVEVRHSAFTCREYDVASRFERFYEMKHLRTFMALRYNYWECYISPTVLDVMIERLKYLRVLTLPYAIKELPDSIDCLKHLRCLDLSLSHIEILPESLCKLFNLKALILFRCEMLRELPKCFCKLINLQILDIRGTNSLEGMPLGIWDMKNLHVLGKIVVGKSDKAMMLELLKIPNVHGRQHISELQNVINVEDVVCWKMTQLEGIDRLKLEWTYSCNEKNEQEILSALKPQKNILELIIKYYGGLEWPSWIGDPWFGKMKNLELHNCCNAASFPTLGQLTSLEELTLKGMNEVKEVGMSFYGNVPSPGDVFPSLKILRIENMKELYAWPDYSIDEGGGQVLPKLKKLVLNNCPKLEVCSFSFPNLQELLVDGCKEGFLTSISNLQSLTKLKIGNITGLESLNGAFLETLRSLQEMVVSGCNELKNIWKDEFNVERVGCLKKLEIFRCEEMVSLVEEDEGNFPPNLQHLSVMNCDKLEKLPNQLHSLTSLTYFRVCGCPKLETFPTRGLPYSVKHVTVWDCVSLTSLPEGMIVNNNDNTNSHQMYQIEELSIFGCHALILPSKVVFPASLRELEIISGPIEAQLFRSLQLQNDLSRLTSLRIRNCPNFESFLDTTPPIPTLLYMSLRECMKLRSLPDHMNQFTSLQTLEMYDCPEVASFPEGGLPTKLKELEIAYCDKLERNVMLERSLSALTCLETLTVEVGGGMDYVNSLPHDSLLLPTSLIHLQICGFQNLKSISSGIQRLTSLRELRIAECAKLQSMPRVGFPPSLGSLQIYKCPILEKQCTKGKGPFWPLVASIPLFKLQHFGSMHNKPGRLRK